MGQDAAHHQPDRAAPLRGMLPVGWECWAGVAGLLYARRQRTSPPVVLRDVTTDGLARQVAHWEHQHTHHPRATT
jgi:hypothetical protein